MKWLRENLGELGGVILYILFFCLTIFGITRAFHRGVGNGVASIFMPPYAWYCSVAYLWEKPEWKLEYDMETSHLAIALIVPKPEKVDAKVILSDELQSLHDWMKQMPKSESDKLKSESGKLCDVWIGFEEQECDALLNNRSLIDIHV